MISSFYAYVMIFSASHKKDLRIYILRSKEARTGFEPVITVLQTGALPLGYRAILLNYHRLFE